MADPYTLLGVRRDATQDEVRAAYRRLAKLYHPDLHPGDREAERRFKDVTAAYDILGDKDKRGRYDRGEIDDGGSERPQSRYQYQHPGSDPGFRYRPGAGAGPGADFGDLGDLFSDLLNRRTQGGFGGAARGQDIRYALEVTFEEAANGASKRVGLPDGRTLDVKLPPGIEDRQTLRLRGQGQPAPLQGVPGDALVEIKVARHPIYRREGEDVHSTVPVTMAEALLGARVEIQTVAGPVHLTVPKGTNSGTVLRLRGRGIANPRNNERGDHYVRFEVKLPPEPDSSFTTFIQEWEARNKYDPGRTKG